MTTTMKAVRVHEYGGAEVLRFEDAPRPEAKDGEVLVQVVAAGVNPIDWKTRAGYLSKMVPLALPWIPGGDFSGVVESVGAGVKGLAAGDQIFGRVDLPHDGSYAEYLVVPRRAIARKPRTLDHVHAAGVPLAALTAWQALFGNGGPSLELGARQTLLILGASGGVGSFALQFATWEKARVVAADRSGQEAQLRALGAAQVIDTRTQRLDSAGEVDAVLDLVGGELQSAAWAQLRRGGTLASTMGAPPEADAKARGAKAVAVYTKTNASQLDEISKPIDAGSIRVKVAKALPLQAAQQAHELLERGGVHGKVVLTVAM